MYPSVDIEPTLATEHFSSSPPTEDAAELLLQVEETSALSADPTAGVALGLAPHPLDRFLGQFSGPVWDRVFDALEQDRSLVTIAD